MPCDPGRPSPARTRSPIPSTSLGAVLVAISSASITFGLAFGRFLIYFGAGLLIASLGVVARERRAQRRARAAGMERSTR